MACGVMLKTRAKKNKHEETETTGTFWRVTILEKATRLRVVRSIDKKEGDATVKALSLLAQRNGMSTPPPLASDGHNGCGEAMKEVWGQLPGYKGFGPRPKHKVALQGWQHLKIIKNKEKKEVSTFCEKKVVYGEEQTVMLNLGVGTVHLERSHLTMRNFNARIARKGLGMSKNLQMHCLAAAWEDAYYNLCHKVRSLKKPLDVDFDMNQDSKFKIKWLHRTPMMAANITNHVWTVKDLLYSLPSVVTHQLSDG